MQWDAILQDPRVIENYDLLKETGILEYNSNIKIENINLKRLIAESYEIFRKESVEELVNYTIKCLSDKFVPSSLIFILNQGIMINKIKSFVYRNLKYIESELNINNLEPYENFFKKYNGTTSYLIFESEINNIDLISPFNPYNPEIIVPVKGLSGLYGIILFGPKVLGQEYSAEEITYIDRLTKFTSIGIQNNIHYEHSVREPKTGLYNHNFFVRRVEEETARAKRTGNPFSVIMLDIDKFKDLNDKYGHLAGDEIIFRLAAKLKQVLREEDLLSRFGGEEFMVLLPHTDRKAAWIASERIRTAVEEMETLYQDNLLKITVSLGIATFDDAYSEEDNLLKRVDTALYKSKNNGRNRSSFIEPYEFPDDE